MSQTIEDKQYFNLEDGQLLYYERHGRVEDPFPILFLHGGPGLGCNKQDLRFFNLEQKQIILVDQRGSGKSLPKGVLENNTSSNIVADLHKLIDYLQIEQVILFGGSWGATLASLFAIKYPERVRAQILRGFFPANQACINFFEGGEVKLFFPEAWERYISLVPKEEQTKSTAYYFRMLSSENKEVQLKYAYESIRYASSMLRIESPNLDEIVVDESSVEKAKIQSYYSLHNFFIPDNYIFEQADKIKHIPTWIIHGRYDMICPPIYAYRLHQLLDKSTLHIVNGGHLASEPNIEIALKNAVNELNFLI